MAGITGRQVNAAYARSSTWNTPASVTQQILIQSTAGLDDQPSLVDDPAFGQDYLGTPEIGDRPALTPTIPMQLRFEQGCDAWIAGAMGSAAAPSSISAGPNSVVAYSHALTLAPVVSHMFTLATDLVQYVQEVRTFKVRGFNIKVGNNGVMEIGFPIVGDRATYDSTTNTNSTVNAATVSTPGNRAFRRNVTLRMNAASGGSLVAADALTLAKEFTLDFTRPLASADFVLASSTIAEPEDDGIAEFSMDVTFARMNTVSANSLATAFSAGASFKADVKALGTYINSTSQRSLLFEFPNLLVSKFAADVTGHGLVRPVVTFKGYMADAAPTGMSGLTNPLRVTIVNARATNLLA
jgi:hypothetical protein